MKSIRIIWADDEIDLLKPHIIFLEEKGFMVDTVYNGTDAVEKCKSNKYDIIFLDENMPGLTGIETLEKIREFDNNTPTVLITKSEEENIMDKAIGSKISDYLIKPVNPNQIFLTVKKHVQNRQIISDKRVTDYQAEFGKIGLLINQANTFNDWVDIYKKLAYWELELDENTDQGMKEVLVMQYNEANSQFARFIKNNYIGWFDEKNKNKPLLSPNLFKEKIFPLTDNNKKVVVLLIDNLRYDQWRVLAPTLGNYYKIITDELYCGILPSTTQYSRNAIFAGLMPLEIEKLYPALWSYDDEEGKKNLFEEELLQSQLSRLGKGYKFFYRKIQNVKEGQKLINSYTDLLKYQLSVIIYNFVDMLSHARTDREIIRELANDESAYRSLTLSWFEHSTLFELLKLLARQDITLLITTDHGSIKVLNALKVIGDKYTSTNLRYKTGKNLNYNEKEVFDIKDPASAHLPSSNVTSKYIFATKQDFFAYPSNYNYYVNFYKNTFQHGGISMQEILIPVIHLEPL